jgi:hypothetical protein
VLRAVRRPQGSSSFSESAISSSGKIFSCARRHFRICDKIRMIMHYCYRHEFDDLISLGHVDEHILNMLMNCID